MEKHRPSEGKIYVISGKTHMPDGMVTGCLKRKSQSDNCLGEVQRSYRTQQHNRCLL